MVQKKIVQHFVKSNQGKIIKEYIDDGRSTNTLQDAFNFSKKQKVTFIVPTFATLSNDIQMILSIRKKLKNRFIACDIPFSDTLSLETAYVTLQITKQNHSIVTKAGMEKKKQKGKIFGSPQNLQTEQRQLGLARIRSKSLENKENQKVIKAIYKCRQAEMGR